MDQKLSPPPWNPWFSSTDTLAHPPLSIFHPFGHRDCPAPRPSAEHLLGVGCLTQFLSRLGRNPLKLTWIHVATWSLGPHSHAQRPQNPASAFTSEGWLLVPLSAADAGSGFVSQPYVPRDSRSFTQLEAERWEIIILGENTGAHRLERNCSNEHSLISRENIWQHPDYWQVSGVIHSYRLKKNCLTLSEMKCSSLDDGGRWGEAFIANICYENMNEPELLERAWG